MLFTLATDPGCSARRILDDLGVEAAHFKRELADCIPPPPRPGRRGRKPARRDPGRRACSFCGECVHLAGEIVVGQHEQAQHEQAQHEQAQHEQAQHEQAQHEQAQHEQAQHEQAAHELQPGRRLIG
ncbi:hypothetical protein [Nonomuraea rubra]|uniref:hypothetical protein n=1 Tax=Nonomuraea rubra TaxID=46180 RepID=UPI0035E516F3